MNGKAYTVWSGQFEDIELHGIFSSLEKAEEYIMKNWKDWYSRCWIEWHTVDDPDDVLINNIVKGWDIIGYTRKEKELVYNGCN